MKRTLLQCLLCVATVLGCSADGPAERVLTIAMETSPNQLDPALVIDVAEGQICSMIYQGLVRFSPHGAVVPDAASSWDVEEGGRRYVFHLDTRARFSDANPVRAAHVVASFERVLMPASHSSRQWVLDRVVGAGDFVAGRAESLRGVRAVDDSTVVVELEAPFRPFLPMLAMPAACIVEPQGTELLGSGPWVLARWERGDYILLRPNPNYGGPQVHLDAVKFRIIPEAFTRIAEFESGALDILKIPQAELERFLDNKSMADRIQSRPELRVAYIGLNNTRGPLRDVRVRRALNMAVDVDRLIEVLTGGHGVRAAGAIPPSLPGYEARPAYPYDPEAAKRLLAEAGYAHGFEMEIWQRDSPEGNRVVEAVQGYLAGVGVRVRIVKREWSAFKEAVSQGRVDACFLDWWADYPDAENFLFPLFHSMNAGGGGNRAFFADPEVDTLIEQAQRVQDADEGAALYARIDGRVYERAPWIYLYFPTTFVAVSERVTGYVFPSLYLGEDLSGVRITPEGKR